MLMVGTTLAHASAIYLPAQILSFGTIIGGGSATVFFDKFDKTDPGLGLGPNQVAVLTSVAIGIDSTNTGLIQIANFTGVNQTVTGASSTLPLHVSASNLAYTTNAVANTCGAFTTPNPGTCVNTLGGGVGGTVLPFGTPGLDPFGVVPNGANTISGVTGATLFSQLVAGSLASYSSSGPSLGTVGVTVNADPASVTGTGPINVLFGGSASTTGNLTIVYGYDIVNVPEPVTTTLTGSAFIGLALLVRRKRKQA